MNFKKSARIIMKAAPFITVTAGVLNLALSKYEESKEIYSREFSDIEDELKAKIEEVKKSNGN